MATQIELGGIPVEVQFKKIKNVHLSVHPPAGSVRISAPERMSLETVRVFAISKLGWIRAQQKKLLDQPRETPRDFLERESHYLWGKRYLLDLRIRPGKAAVAVTHQKIIVTTPGPPTAEKLSRLLDDFYRTSLREEARKLVAKWERRLGISVNQIYIQRMKTRWGSCNPSARNIRLNLDLAKKNAECLEYVALHEMLHFFVQNHGPNFIKLMDQHMPHWRQIRQRLNETPLSHIEWTY